MTNINHKLINRLERAEYLIRADLADARLKALEYEIIADELSEQAEILSNARIELWENAKKSHDVEKEVTF